MSARLGPGRGLQIPESTYQFLLKLAQQENTDVISILNNLPQFYNRANNIQKEYEELIHAFNEVRNENLRLKEIIADIFSLIKHDIPK